MRQATIGVLRFGSPDFSVLWEKFDSLRRLAQDTRRGKSKIILPSEIKVPRKIAHRFKDSIVFENLPVHKGRPRTERDREIVNRSDRLIILWDGNYSDSVRLVDMIKKKGKPFSTVFAPNGNRSNRNFWQDPNYDAIVWFATLALQTNGVFIDSQKVPLNKGSLPLIQLMFPRVEETLAQHLSARRFSPYYAGRFQGKSVFIVPVNDVMSVTSGFELDQFVLNSAFEQLKEMLKSMKARNVVGVVSVANTVDINELQQLLKLKAEGIRDFNMKIVRHFSPDAILGSAEQNAGFDRERASNRQEHGSKRARVNARFHRNDGNSGAYRGRREADETKDRVQARFNESGFQDEFPSEENEAVFEDMEMPEI